MNSAVVVIVPLLVAAGAASEVETLGRCRSPAPPGSPSERVQRIVVRLERGARSAGTAFLVESQGRSFLVTAGHVAGAGEPLRARLPPDQGTPGRSCGADLAVPPEAWVRHPLGPSRDETTGRSVSGVDLAAVEIPEPPPVRIEALRGPDPAATALPSEIARGAPRPPEEVIAFGFPEGLGSPVGRAPPIERSGTLALVVGEPQVRYREEDSYTAVGTLLLDLESLPGYSGGPVFRESSFERTLELVGVLTAGIRAEGSAIAEPASRVIELLEHAARSQPAMRAAWETPPCEPPVGSEKN